MGTKNLKGTVSVEKLEKRLRLRWRYQKKRYCLNLFGFSKANMLRARQIAVQIEKDISAGRFDSTLSTYKPKESQTATITQKTIVEKFEEWVKDYRNMDCDRDIDYHSTRSMMRRGGAFNVEATVSLLSKEKLSARTYNRRLTLLHCFFKWAERTKFVESNPLNDVLPKKARKTEKANRKPFSSEEIQLILEAFKNDTFTVSSSGHKHSHYYPFLYFLFVTGVRNAEAVGLRVQHIDITKNLVHIKEALSRTIKGTNAAARVRKETKNGKQRVLPLSEDLLKVLHPLMQGKKPDDLLFQSPTGKAIDDRMFQKRIFSNILRKLNIDHRVLYACRHTFGTRLINAGVNPVTTAFLMGNNPETALRNYTHLTELPSALPAL